MGALLAILALLAVAAVCGRGLARQRLRAGEDAELSLFPRSAAARPLFFGRTRLAADLAWLEAIQYYGRHRKTDRRYPYAGTLFRTLTDLDPGFETAYLFGALVLCEEAGDDAAGRALLKDGMRANPKSWLLCFEYGFFAYLRHKDSPEGAEYMARASRMPGAPESVARLAAFAAEKAGDRDLAVDLWRVMLQSARNEEMRRIARRYLRALGAPEASGFSGQETL